MAFGSVSVPDAVAENRGDGLMAPPLGDLDDGLVLDLDGFEGPIDLLLTLARAQKVDLARISILQLADQYLDYVRRAHSRRLELAADYLVTAAWLAWMKSRLLLPDDKADDGEPGAAELAEALAFRLRRLEAMRKAAGRLMARDLLGRDVFARGAAEGIEVVTRPVFAITLNDLIAAYAAPARRRARRQAFRVAPSRLLGLADAVRRLSAMLGMAVEWTTLVRFLPGGEGDPLRARSELASTFAASLELAREGRVEMRQAAPFGPILLRRREPPDGPGAPERGSP